MAIPSCRMFDAHSICNAKLLACASAGKSSAISNAIIEITTSNSMSVKPLDKLPRISLRCNKLDCTDIISDSFLVRDCDTVVASANGVIRPKRPAAAGSNTAVVVEFIYLLLCPFWADCDIHRPDRLVVLAETRGKRTGIHQERIFPAFRST